LSTEGPFYSNPPNSQSHRLFIKMSPRSLVTQSHCLLKKDAPFPGHVRKCEKNDQGTASRQKKILKMYKSKVKENFYCQCIIIFSSTQPQSYSFPTSTLSFLYLIGKYYMYSRNAREILWMIEEVDCGYVRTTVRLYDARDKGTVK
jgi:hypothetical protein